MIKIPKWKRMYEEHKEQMLDYGAKVVKIEGVRYPSFTPSSATAGLEYALTIPGKIKVKYLDPIKPGEKVNVQFSDKGRSICISYQKMSDEEIMQRKILKEMHII